MLHDRFVATVTHVAQHYAMCVTAMLLLAGSTVAGAQSRPAPTVTSNDVAASKRPIPGAVYESAPFTRAVLRGTRTRTGVPGPRNWVQHARYSIDVSLDTATHTVTGAEHITYINNSPDTLPYLLIHLRQNVFKAESQRRSYAPISSGMRLIRVNGLTLTGSPDTVATPQGASTVARLSVDGTVMRATLAAPLAPHDSVQLGFDWSYVPAMTPSDGREGRDTALYFMGYWYPQIAVYDDVDGWVADQYLLQAEFYMDPADYDVRITVPRGWVVGATGTLRNASAILTTDTRARLALARRTDSVVTIATPGRTMKSIFATSAPVVTWHFTAPDVRDFAWGTSDRYVWDATRAIVSDATQQPDTVDIYSFYRRTAAAAAWAVGGARFTRDAIEQLSKYLWKYPWPTMTSMEGILTGGGMEYPRLTVMQPWADTLSLAGDLMHETGHMWFPMQVGSNETRHPWMDEGLTQFDEAQAMRPLYGEPRTGGRIADTEQGQRLLYTRVARAGHDQSLMQNGDLFPSAFYNIIFYDKTAQVLAALRGLLGEPTFHKALREYGKRWIGRHPYPNDFFNTFDDISHQDLSWFWNTWFYNAWPLEQAVASVTQAGDSVAITIEDRGMAPMPVMLAITRADSTVQRIDIPVTVWLTGARRHTINVARRPDIVHMEIDPDGLFPEINRATTP
jgi:hypothetical protein